MEYPDYYPKQMKFRRDTSGEDAYRRKRKKHPGSYRPSINNNSDINQNDKIASSVSDGKEDNRDYLHLKPKLRASLAKRENIRPNKLTTTKHSHIVRKTQRQRKAEELLAYYSNYYRYHVVSSREVITRLYNNSKNEYLFLIDKDTADIGCLYNKKSIKYESELKTNAIYALNCIIKNHLTLTNRRINIICNDDAIAQLNNIKNEDPEELLEDWVSSIFVRNMVMYGYCVIVWRCDNPHEIAIDRWIKSIEHYKPLKYT